jgi:hypothetical protein
MKLIAGLCAAMAISTVGLIGQAPAPQGAITARNVTEDLTTVGCVRAWMPASADVTRLPENREPGMAGMFLLTPLASGPTTAVELPTYLLEPSATANFQQHLDRKVEVVGVVLSAPRLPTVREIVTVSTQLPENKPNLQSMPRLTVRSIRRVADSCPS